MKRGLEEDKKPMPGVEPATKTAEKKEQVPATVPVPAVGEEKKEQIRVPKKKKVIMIIGYNGSEFVGSQKQPTQDVRTVEGEIEKALYKEHLISAQNYGNLKKIAFTRATRTDKKVHALQNFFSAEMLLDLETPMEDYKIRLQKALPSDIKLFALIRGSEGFNTKLCCSAREYLYYLPTFCLQPVVPKTQANYEDCYKYRISPEVMGQLNTLCAKFVGTHKFHNYTCGLSGKQGQANRYIMEFKAAKTLVVDSIEFVEIYVKGQSFLYNQIRKMVGMIIHILRKNLPTEIIENSCKENYFITPLAPGNGLMLKRVCYDRYNKKKGDDVDNVLLPEADAESTEQFTEELRRYISKQEKESNM